MLLLGGLTGIVCRDQTSTGTIAGPLALVFMLPTMFAGMGGVLQKVASFVPTTATADLMFLGLGHQSWMGGERALGRRCACRVDGGQCRAVRAGLPQKGRGQLSGIFIVQ